MNLTVSSGDSARQGSLRITGLNCGKGPDFKGALRLPSTDTVFFLLFHAPTTCHSQIKTRIADPREHTPEIWSLSCVWGELPRKANHMTIDRSHIISFCSSPVQMTCLHVASLGSHP